MADPDAFRHVPASVRGGAEGGSDGTPSGVRRGASVGGSGSAALPSVRPPWTALETLRPLTLRACRRIVVIAPHPRDEIRAAGGLLHRLAARHATVDVLSLTDLPTRTCTPPSGTPAVGGWTLPTGSDGAGVAHPHGLPGPGDPIGASELVGLDELDRLVLPGEQDDAPDDAADDTVVAGRDSRLAADAYRALGLSSVRRHRLGLADGGVARSEADVVAAISEIVGFAAEEPSGLCVLAPWSGDGDDDHEAAGRAAEVATAAYRVRLVRWLDRAWTWAGPDSSEVPWRRARQVALSETALARKLAAGAAFGDRPGHDLELPDGSAPGPREVFLV